MSDPFTDVTRNDPVPADEDPDGIVEVREVVEETLPDAEPDPDGEDADDEEDVG